MKVFLVIDESKGKLLKYSEVYRIFSDPDAALAYAKAIGYKDEWGLGFNVTIGMLNMYWAGDTKISIIPLETYEQSKSESK